MVAAPWSNEVAKNTNGVGALVQPTPIDAKRFTLLKRAPHRLFGGVLLDVLPESGVQSPGNQGEEREEDQHPNTEANPLVLGRLAHPLQKRHQIGHGQIVLLGRELARSDLLEAGE